MKKFFYIGFILALAIATVLLFHLFRGSGDNLIRQKMVGQWLVGYDPNRTIENRADGSFTVTDFEVKGQTNVMIVEGAWSVSGGYLIGTVTNSSLQIPSWDRTESNKIISVNDAQIIMRSSMGRTNQVILHRKIPAQ